MKSLPLEEGFHPSSLRIDDFSSRIKTPYIPIVSPENQVSFLPPFAPISKMVLIFLSKHRQGSGLSRNSLSLSLSPSYALLIHSSIHRFTLCTLRRFVHLCTTFPSLDKKRERKKERETEREKREKEQTQYHLSRRATLAWG